jgi:hypothetical protein
MKGSRMRTFLRSVCFILVLAMCAFSYPASTQPPPATTVNPLEGAFEKGWILEETNNDGIADFLRGHIIVPAHPAADENAAAANLAARLGYETTGLTLPVVETSTEAAAAIGPKIFVGSGSLPASVAAELASLTSLLGPGEGGVFLTSDEER